MRRVQVRGIEIDLLPLAAAAAHVVAVAQRAAGGSVCLANVHVVETARRDSALAAALKAADLVLPDGAPLVWVARARGEAATRVTGSDLFASVLGGPPLRHYFLGGAPDVLERVVARVADRWPAATVAGSYSPPYAPVDEMNLDEIANRIRASGAQVVWVGLGAPKQELVMHRLAEVTSVQVGVGAVFEFIAGSKRRAPRLLQRAGLEWAFRLAQEPRRLARRYVVTNATFGVGALRELLSGGRR